MTEPLLSDFYSWLDSEPIKTSGADLVKDEPKKAQAENLELAKAKRFGVGYMGSKNQIVKKLIPQLPSAKYFVDLFAGGCAMTHGAMLSGKYERFIANDIGDAPSLFLRATKGEFRDEKRWISRDDFKTLKDSDPYIRYVWSFGNKGTQYLYGKEIEPYKKAFWEFAVLKNPEPLREYGFNVDELLDLPTSYERRIAFKKYLAKMPFIDKKGSHFYYKSSELSKYKGFKENTMLDNLQSLESLESLQRLERLQSLERLERLQSLEVYQGCYKELKLPEPSECVIYCDPPYAGTAKYISGDFDHEGFYEYVCELARQGYKVFISEYWMPPERFKSVFNVEKRQQFHGLGAGKVKQEHLFVPIVS